mgnify:CR=1
MMYMVRKGSKNPQKCINGVKTLVDYLKSNCLQLSSTVSLSSQNKCIYETHKRNNKIKGKNYFPRILYKCLA